MRKYIIGTFLLLTSCTMSKDICVVRHVLTPRLKYSLNIPMGYKIEQYEVTVEKEIRYVYKDSSFIYITNFCNTPNYGNIKSLGDSILQYRFQNEELTKQINEILGKPFIAVLPDTLQLSGTNSKSLFWKDIKIGKLSIGYCNVPKERKCLFDKSLKTIKIKQ